METLPKFKNSLGGKHERWANEIVDSIERPVMVMDPSDTSTLKTRDIKVPANKEGKHSVIDYPVTEGPEIESINAKEWLGCACQEIKWGNCETCHVKDSWGAFIHKLGKYLTPTLKGYVEQYLEQDAYAGEIVLKEECKSFIEYEFKFVVGHELLHVFNLMKIIVPSLKYRKDYWENICNKGVNIVGIIRKCDVENLDITDKTYDIEYQRSLLSQYWPSQAHKFRKPKVSSTAQNP